MTSILKYFYHFRDCSSKNFNQSPFCTAGNKFPPIKWTEKVREMYKDTIGDDLPDYIETIKHSVRDYYGTEKLKKEALLVSNKEVMVILFLSRLTNI